MKPKPTISSHELKNFLVDYILDIWGNPDSWPLTDQQRILFLKDLYERAKIIKDMERKGL